MAFFDVWPPLPRNHTFVAHTDSSQRLHLPQVHLPTSMHTMTHIFDHHRNASTGKPSVEPLPWSPDSDIYETSSQYILEMNLPGVSDKKSIIVEWLTARTLHIECVTERFQVNEEENNHDMGEGKGKNEATLKTTAAKGESTTFTYLLQERKPGPFQRNFTFPIDVDMEGLKAKLDAGVLRVAVPKKHSDGPGIQIKLEVE